MRESFNSPCLGDNAIKVSLVKKEEAREFHSSEWSKMKNQSEFPLKIFRSFKQKAYSIVIYSLKKPIIKGRI